MYHSVGRILADWAWSELTTPAAIFEDHLNALASAGYRTVTLREWSDHVSGRKPITGRSVVLTFDDGYLDNWSYVIPMLERHGFHGVVLATVDFVDPAPGLRPTLRDVWAGRMRDDELDVRAFMSWDELRAGSESGVLDVQSHAVTHTWYPTGDEVVDFHHPGDSHYWLDWNAAPERKPFYLKELSTSRVAYGTPVYRHGKSLACRRFFPPPGEAEHCASFAARMGESFFASPDWKERLRRELFARRRSHPEPGRYETEDERRTRVESEVVGSKRILSERLGRPVDFMVWPGGGYDDESMRIGRATYEAVTVAGPERRRFHNRPGENAGRIIRRGAPTIDTRGKSWYAPGAYLVDSLEEFRLMPGARFRRRVRKSGYLIANRLGMWPR